MINVNSPTFNKQLRKEKTPMLKITLKESEFKTLIEKTVRKALNEATLGHATDEDPVDDNFLPSELQDWLDENYPQEMREGMRGYEEIIQDLGEKNQLTSEIINFFIKNMNQYAESWMHNLNMFKERCERYKQYYKVSE